MSYNALINQVYKEALTFARAQGWVDSKWTCAVKIDTSPRRTRSWGGTRGRKPFISLAINPHIRTASLTEYASFKHDPVIGSVSGSVEKSLAALVVHELAHALQYSGDKNVMAGNNNAVARDSQSHGALWRRIYRELRANIVNNKEWAPVAKTANKDVQFIQTTTNVPSRKDAQARIYHAFKAGNTASTIIKSLVALGMKKTTATTYTYEVKRVYAF